MWIEYVFCFGQMSFRLFEFCDIGKFGDYLVDNVSTQNRESIKVSKDSGRRPGDRNNRYNGLCRLRPNEVPFPASGI